jgi:hypothetical protein
MGDQPADGRHRGALVEEGRQARLQMAACHGEAVSRDLADEIAVPQIECLLENALDLKR